MKKQPSLSSIMLKEEDISHLVLVLQDGSTFTLNATPSEIKVALMAILLNK